MQDKGDGTPCCKDAACDKQRQVSHTVPVGDEKADSQKQVAYNQHCLYDDAHYLALLHPLSSFSTYFLFPGSFSVPYEPALFRGFLFPPGSLIPSRLFDSFWDFFDSFRDSPVPFRLPLQAPLLFCRRLPAGSSFFLTTYDYLMLFI